MPAMVHVVHYSYVTYCICDESPRLLQRASGGPSAVNHRAAATSPDAAVRLISGLRPRDRMTSSLRELHWFPIRYRIIFKLRLMMHNAHVGRSPRYIIKTLSPIVNMLSRGRLRS